MDIGIEWNCVTAAFDLANIQSHLQIKLKWKLSRTPMNRPSVPSPNHCSRPATQCAVLFSSTTVRDSWTSRRPPAIAADLLLLLRSRRPPSWLKVKSSKKWGKPSNGPAAEADGHNKSQAVTGCALVAVLRLTILPGNSNKWPFWRL